MDRGEDVRTWCVYLNMAKYGQFMASSSRNCDEPWDGMGSLNFELISESVRIRRGNLT